MLTGKTIKITPLGQEGWTSKVALVINQHMGVHPDNEQYIRDQYEDESEFLEWYDPDNYSTFYLSTGDYIECDEMTGVMKLNDHTEVDYDVLVEFIVR